MSGQHPKSEAWDRALQTAVEAVDREMERRHGQRFKLGWNRAASGTTANPQMDGIFNIGVKFTLGYGSLYGRGYLLDVQLSTSELPSPALRAQWEKEAAELMQHQLAQIFPERNLKLERDGRNYKITGDFSLGEV